MAEYKLYCLDQNGRIWRRHDLEADDDAAAIAAARITDSATCELWCGVRKVALLPAGSDPIVAGAAPGAERPADGRISQ